MKTRKEAAEFINSGKLIDAKNARRPVHHGLGMCDLRVLMDFIYGGEPKTEKEKVRTLGDDR